MSTVEILNVDKLTRKLAKYNGAVSRAVAKEIADGTLKIAGDAVRSISTISPGSQEPNSKGHRASAPGEAPNTDTGRLVQSIFFKIEDGGLSGRTGTDLAYGHALEFGTSKMDARPWLRPAFEKNIKDIEARIALATSKAIKKGAK